MTATPEARHGGKQVSVLIVSSTVGCRVLVMFGVIVILIRKALGLDATRSRSLTALPGLAGVRSSCFTRLYAAVRVSPARTHLAEVRRTPVPGAPAAQRGEPA
jgi:hypothetical protein